MNVLITNIILSTRTGSETLTRDLALELFAMGHSPVVYTLQAGQLSDEIKAHGVPVITDINLLTEEPDVIHGHHTITTAIAAARFRKTPALFVCQDFTAWHDEPPRLPSILRYVAIGRTSARRLTWASGIPRHKVAIVPDGVDAGRFRPGPPLPETPRSALAFCRSEAFARAVKAACDSVGLEIVLAGPAVGNVIERPEAAMPAYDIVFASGRTAREAIACGRAVVCCDERGVAGMISPQRFELWGRNLGLAVLNQPVTPEVIVSEIRLYDAEAASALSRGFVRTMRVCAEDYVELYRAIRQEWSDMTVDDEEFSRAVVSFMQSHSPPVVPFYPWQREREELLKRLYDFGSSA